MQFLLSNLALLFHPTQVTRTFADSKVGSIYLGSGPQSVCFTGCFGEMQALWLSNFYTNENYLLAECVRERS